MPEDYQRKQTLVGGERYTMPELQEHEYKVLHAQEQQQEMEQTLLRQVCAQVAAHGERIGETAGAVANVDVYCALAEVAASNGYVRPVRRRRATRSSIRDGRHPVVERMLAEGTFVPNDARSSSGDAQVMLLTGPNMAGKSTYLRQVALIVLMAQIGSFVPAAEARIGVVDRIFSRVGALDDIASGRSTFMVEMVETAAILHNATPRSLLIFDEIGRGTSTYDGMAIARAVVEFMHNRPRRGGEDAVRDALPRADGAGGVPAARAELQRGGDGGAGAGGVPAPHPAGRRRPLLRHPRGAAGGAAAPVIVRARGGARGAGGASAGLRAGGSCERQRALRGERSRWRNCRSSGGTMGCARSWRRWRWTG